MNRTKLEYLRIFIIKHNQTNNKVQKLVECVIANHRTTTKLVEYTNRLRKYS